MTARPLRSLLLLALLTLAPAAWSQALAPTPGESPEDAAPPSAAASLPGFSPAESAAQRAYEEALLAVPARETLARTHELLTREPHPAGTGADARMIETLGEELAALGLDVETHEFFAYLPVHRGSRVEVITTEGSRSLPLQEAGLEEDPYSRSEKAQPAWNAYSGAGDVTGGVVYVNYGREEDFAKLADLGVSLQGKIAIARYGKIYRGYKVKFAEAAGAAGVLLYTDPDDSGYRRGIPYPEGGYANEHSIQRGSVKTLPYPGDPLTPFEAADEDAARLDPAELALPEIPVQALGWGAAAEILGAMSGRAVPRGWQGGLPFAYRVTDGGSVRARIVVDQMREVRRSANVVGSLEGARRPEQMVILGCHFDAWTFGAGDPHAGSIVLFEIARAFAEAAKEGRRPDRTILFANWGAEEFGIIGSVEWAEKHRERLAKNAVAYVNLDMAAMGPRFSASASPLLKEVIEEATRAVPDPAGEGESVHELWLARHGGDPRFGDLGGGSDHLGFYAHLAVPAAGFGAWGSRGVSYHTNYETLTWYRQVVGDDYGPAQMLARLGAVVTARLANAPVLPYDVARVAEDTRRHLAELLGEENEGPLGSPAKEALVALRRAIDDYEESALAAERALALALEEGSLDAAEQAAVDRDLIALERAWLAPEGLPGRPWYRHTFASTDPSSGYAPMMLPLLALALQDASASLPPEEALAHYAEVFEEMTRVVERVHARLVGTQAAADGEKRR